MVGGLAGVPVGTLGSNSKQAQIFEVGEVGDRQAIDKGNQPVLVA